MSSGLRFLLLVVPLAIAAVFFAERAGERPGPDGQPIFHVVLEDRADTAVLTERERAFEQELEEIGAALDGQAGVAVLDVKSGREYDFNGDDLMPQQSVSKLWTPS